MKKVRVRYAPSPTGHLHIGGARTALFNYLFAKHYDGDFIFRLEDTDIERNIEGGEASQLDNLAWLGIVPDEVPAGKTYEFDDMIRGHVSFESDDIGDWVLVKANGIPTYNYAVVIDDHTMDITHVFRGEEHLSNTPKQLMIYDMFGWTAPTYGHMTLIVNEQRKKLSKRDESIMQFVSQYKEEGYLPDAMFNFMALLGWSPEGEQEIFTKEELIKEFSEKRYGDGGLDRKLIQMSLWEALNFLEGLDKEIVKLVDLFFNDELNLDDEAKEFMKDESIPNTLNVFKEQLLGLSDFSKENIQACIKATQKEAKVKGKMLYMPLRIATTGIMHGPDLASSICLLGKEKVLSRLEQF